MNNIIISLTVGFVIFTAGFGVGYKTCEDSYHRAIETVMAEQNAKRHEEEQKLADAIADRDSKLDQARADSDDLRRDLERLRNTIGSNRLPQAATDSCKSLARENEKLRRLLAEGASLLQECTGELGRCAINNDALINLNK